MPIEAIRPAAVPTFASDLTGASSALTEAIASFQHPVNSVENRSEFALKNATSANNFLADAIQNRVASAPSAAVDAVKQGQVQLLEGMNEIKYRLNGALNVDAVIKSFTAAQCLIGTAQSVLAH